MAVLALLAGLAIGRFVTYEPPARPAAAPTAARTLEARVASLERAVEADPADLESWQALGVAYTQRALEVGDPAFYELAGRALDRADGLDREHAATLLARGHLALALHDFAGAREYGERARRLRPHSAEVLGVLVDAAVELGDYDAAARHLQDMLDLRPSLPALARTSYLRELHGDLAGAVKAMQRAESAGSGSAFDVATVRALLGNLHFMGGDLPAAEAAHVRALEAAPGLVAAEVGLARVEAARGDTGAAIERLTAVVDRFPQPDAVILLGDLHARAGDHELAREQHALARVIARLQEDAGQNVDLELALFEADRGEDPERALELARRAYDARPANVYAADVLAWALLRAGRAEEAVAPMEDALRLDTADPLVRFHAAEVFAATGDTDRARNELAMALERNPWFSVAHHERARELAGRLGVAPPVAWDDAG
ncbi:MAG TPA: tetratricopeptide repeat protein [Egibacteraceae bacterium]|nr:tetratricopeptide repeat protein [Egibacteraceae bacterium]